MSAILSAAPAMPKTGFAAALFGLVTIVTGGAALFAALDMGHIVPFVLWFNFLAGFAYVAAGVMIGRGLPGALPLAALLAMTTVAVAGAFAGHVAAGEAFEMRTVGALILRAGFWIGLSWALWSRAQPRSQG